MADISKIILPDETEYDLKDRKLFSRGEQLITNGNGMLADNTNFHSLSFDGSKANGTPGSFTNDTLGVRQTILSDDYFPVNTEKNYEVEVDLLSLNKQGSMYTFLSFFDADKSHISVDFHGYYVGSDAVLMTACNSNTSTSIIVDDASYFASRVGTNVKLLFWDYTNSFGYIWPAHTYTRNITTSVTISSVSDNTVTFATKLGGANMVHSAGTVISVYRASATYKYVAVNNNIPDNTSWTHYKGYIGGVDYSGQNVSNKFPPGVAYCKFGFLWNYNKSNDRIWATNISVREYRDALTVNGHTIKSDVPANAKFTDTTYSAGSNITLTDTTFSLTKANVVGALGYTPPEQDTNTTYSAGTGLVLDSNKFYNKGAEFIRGTQTAATAAWTGVTLDPELYDGKEIIYFLPFNGTSSSSTLNLTLSTGETTGAKYVYFNSTTRHTTQYEQHQMIRMVYHESLVIGTTTYSGWWIDYARDLNDSSYKSYLYYSAAKALRTADAGGRYTLTFTKDDQYVLPITSTDNKTGGQAKTYTTESFDPFGDIFYRVSSGAIAENANVPNASLYRQYMVDARYSFTGVTSSASTSVMKAGDPVYIVCVPQSDGKVKLHSNPLGLAKPTTDDGLLYILLGHAYNSYQFELLMHKPVYHFKDGAVRLYNGSGSSYDSATETLTINL